MLVPKKIKDVIEFTYNETEERVGIIIHIYTWESINEFLDLVIDDKIAIILEDRLLREIKEKERYYYKIISGDEFYIMDHYWHNEKRKKTEYFHIDRIFYD